MPRGIGRWKRGRPSPPEGVGPRASRVRIRFGVHGSETSCARFAREMGLDKGRVLAWESRGSFPGREKLAEFYGRLAHVQAEGADPVVIAKWVELGPDDAPPFDEPANLNDARDPTRLEVAAGLAPAQPTTAVPPVDLLAITEKALAIADEGKDPRPLLRFAIDTLRRAKQLGLAGVALALLAGGADGSQERFFRDPSKKISLGRRRRVRGRSRPASAFMNFKVLQGGMLEGAA